MNQELKTLISDQYDILEKSPNPQTKCGILFNIAFIKNEYHLNSYKDIKLYIFYMIEGMKVNDLDYDNFNYSNFNNLIRLIPLNQQKLILDLTLSLLTREFPEFDKSMILCKRKEIEFNVYFDKFSTKPTDVLSLIKGLLIWTSISPIRIIAIILMYISAIYLILLPASTDKMEFFRTSYVEYTEIFLLNHLYNIMLFLVGFESDFKLIPLNGIGIFLMVLFKLILSLLIINYLYRHLIDKINNNV